MDICPACKRGFALRVCPRCRRTKEDQRRDLAVEFFHQLVWDVIGDALENAEYGEGEVLLRFSDYDFRALCAAEHALLVMSSEQPPAAREVSGAERLLKAARRIISRIELPPDEEWLQPEESPPPVNDVPCIR